jgi:hypothetical protein
VSATHDVGDVVKLTFHVRVDGVLTYADAVLTVTDPSGVSSTPPTSHPSTGTYTASILADQPELWLWRWTATGAAVTAEDGSFYVQPATDAATYGTVAEAKRRFGITDTADDELIEKARRAASRRIDNECGRRFYRDTAATPRVYRPAHPEAVNLHDIATAAGLAVAEDTTGGGNFTSGLTATTGYVTTPYNARGGAADHRTAEGGGLLAGPPAASDRAGHRLLGWPRVPDEIRDACMLAVKIIVDSRNAYHDLRCGDLPPPSDRRGSWPASTG